MASSSGGFTVRVEGYREAARALQKVNAGAKREILKGIAEAGRPIADDANRRLGRFTAVGPVKSVGTTGGVFIRQTKRKVSGLRGDFGALQMRDGLIPAVESNEEKIVEHVENALEGLIAREGLA